MVTRLCYSNTFVAVIFACLVLANAETKERFRKHSAGNYTTIHVDQASNANFSTIQSAIDTVPPNNKHWVCISVGAGTYNEQVKIPANKPFIYLKGAGIQKTFLIWAANEELMETPTFTSWADNILVTDISFANSYNLPPWLNNNPVKPAIAAMISGDKSAFYQCGFFGYQDTLLDSSGRHYFKKCKIQGACDFIFGSGQSIYEKSSIVVNSRSIGFITAQGRSSANETNGFVFKECKVIGSVTTYLGRAWRAYSRAIFYNSSLSHNINAQGWSAWNYVGHEDRITFAEHGCHGDGADKSQRVKWEKKLSPKELQKFTSLSYIDTEGWIKNLPVNILD